MLVLQQGSGTQLCLKHRENYPVMCMYEYTSVPPYLNYCATSFITKLTIVTLATTSMLKKGDFSNMSDVS